MKHLFIMLALVAGLTTAVSAREGYRITVKFTDVKDTLVYLVHYYGKPLPTIYKSDSARIDKNGTAIFDKKEKTLGGIYLVLTGDKKRYFEFLLANGDDMTIDANATGVAEGVIENLTYKNSPENERFVAYMNFLKGFGKEQQKLQADYAAAKTKADSTAVRKRMSDAGKQLTDYRHDYVAKYPGTMLAKIFQALEVPQVPEGVHKLPNGQIDSSFAYNYYKEHYWDGFDFRDDRLINTPIYDAKLDEYMNKVVIPYVDSVEKEGDMLLKKTRGTKDLFKYTLHWLTYNAETSKVMGMDEVFVYLVENYHMKGDADWLSNDDLQKYIKRVREIAPNVIGNVAPEIKMKDATGKEIPLSSVNAKYTVVAFWEPSCGHCQKEIPQLDSVYKAVLKAKGVKVYAVRTDDPVTQWQEFIKKNHLEEWINVYDPDGRSNYHAEYDIKATPSIYLLDEKKIIRGKRLDHTNIADVINMLERKEKAAKIKS
jgi:peroxiredoxin